VDLLHRVVGLDRAEIEAHAVTVSLTGSTAPIRVMHPVHVLQSRNANLHTLASKQDEIGCKQFALAIAVARAYLEGRIDEDRTPQERCRERAPARGPGGDQARRRVFGGRRREKNAARYGIFLADAIPAWRIHVPEFWSKQWPQLRQCMSPDYARRCEERSGKT